MINPNAEDEFREHVLTIHLTRSCYCVAAFSMDTVPMNAVG